MYLLIEHPLSTGIMKGPISDVNNKCGMWFKSCGHCSGKQTYFFPPQPNNFFFFLVKSDIIRLHHHIR